MKEATGELNMTVIVVITVGVMSAFFYTVVWPNIQRGQEHIANCNAAVCTNRPNADGTVNCVTRGRNPIEITCPWRG